MSRARRSGLVRTSATGAESKARAADGLLPARRGQLGVGAAEQQALGVGHRLAVAHQDQHRASAAQAGTRMRPHCSQVATSSGRQGADLLDLDRGQLEVAAVAVVPDQAGRAGALEARPQRLVAVGERGRAGAPPRPPGTRRPRPARHRSRARPAATCSRSSAGLRLQRRHALAQRRQLGVDGILLEHGHQLQLLELGPALGQVPHLVVHGLQVAARGAGGGVHALLHDAAPLGDAARSAPRAPSGCPPARRAAPQRPTRSASSAASSASTAASPDVSASACAAVLQLRDGGVEVLDGEQVAECVGHASAS